MDIRFRDASVDRIKTDLLVIPVKEKNLHDPTLRILDRRLNGHLRARIDKSKFTGAEGATLLYPTAGSLPAEQILLIGLGNDESIETWRKAGARGRKESSAAGAREWAIYFAAEKNRESAAGAIVEGALLASYQFNKYRSNAKALAEPKSLTLFRSGLTADTAMRQAVTTSEAVVPAVFLARSRNRAFPGRACRGILPRAGFDSGSVEQEKDRNHEARRAIGRQPR
jgi:leucyl aminopeptidase